MQTVNFAQFPLKKGEKVLDLGCGEGRHVISAYLEQQVTSIGVDLSVDDLKTTAEKFAPFALPDDAQRAFGLLSANALHLPFADNTFDKIICSEVLEHIPDYQQVLNEIERILKPGGLFCVSVPRFWPEWLCWKLSDEYHANEGGHIRIFKSRVLKRQVKEAGFCFYHRHWAHALHSPYWWLKCAFWQTQDSSRLVAWYHKLLVWDMMERPWFTRYLEKALNPLCGKSVVMYFVKTSRPNDKATL